MSSTKGSDLLGLCEGSAMSREGRSGQSPRYEAQAVVEQLAAQIAASTTKGREPKS
jgi:hypothetical protein